MTTPTTPTDLIAWPVAAALRECLCQQWEPGSPQAPQRCCVLPGRDVAIDDCCAGQAWVRVARVYPSTPDTFPEPSVGGQDVDRWAFAGNAGNCDDLGTWAVQLGVGVARCVPVPDEDGNPPSCADLEQAAALQADDRARSWRAVTCCLPNKGVIAGLAVGEWLPAGPAGGCSGGEWQVIVLVDPVTAFDEAQAAGFRPAFYVDGDDDV